MKKTHKNKVWQRKTVHLPRNRPNLRQRLRNPSLSQRHLKLANPLHFKKRLPFTVNKKIILKWMKNMQNSKYPTFSSLFNIWWKYLICFYPIAALQQELSTQVANLTQCMEVWTQQLIFRLHMLNHIQVSWHLLMIIQGAVIPPSWLACEI